MNLKNDKDNSLTFTSAVNEMIDNTPYDKNLMNLIDKNIATNKAVTNLIYELLKQLYSDLSFPKLTNVKNSKTLNEFLRKNKIDD